MPLLLLFLNAGAQQMNIPFTSVPYKTDIRSGNRLFEIDSFTNAPDAEAQYKKALDKENNAPVAVFNLGDAIYQQGRYDTAAKWFELSAKTNPDSFARAKAYHNLGNTYAKKKSWKEAAGAYKEALKINPHDADTRYNLAYANEMLRQQNQGGGGGGQNNKQQQKQQDKQQQKNQENKQNQQQQAQNNQQQKQAPQPKLKKDEAEQLLQAIANEEQKTNQKMQQKQVKAVNVKIEKDW